MIAFLTLSQVILMLLAHVPGFERLRSQLHSHYLLSAPPILPVACLLFYVSFKAQLRATSWRKPSLTSQGKALGVLL